VPRGSRQWLLTAANRILGTRQVNQLVRFEPVLRLLDESAPTTLLDAGSGSTGLGALLPGPRRTVALDVGFDDAGGGPPDGWRVVGDARHLPLADRSVDVVVAVDLLEHVAPADRCRAVGELCRVARRRAVIACPTGTEALETDRRLASRLRRSGREPPPWLEEHLALGFPERDEIVAVAEGFGRVSAFANEANPSHERLILAELNPLAFVPLRLLALGLGRAMRSRSRLARGLAAGVLRRIRGRDGPPAYRTVMAVDIAQAGRQTSR
jgi:SAM-dependent methyltransferase